MLRCAKCSKILLGTFYKDWAGQRVCPNCLASLGRCASCFRFCIPGRAYKSIPVPVCGECARNRISVEVVPKIVALIKEIYAQGGIKIKSPITLKLVEMQKIREVSSTEGSLGVAQRVGNAYTIFVFNALSRVAFADVIAHELLHIYQYENGYAPPADLCEGLCNLGSYVVLAELDRRNIERAEARSRIDALMSNPDPNYGVGFRRLLSLYQASGWPAPLQKLKG